MTTVTKNNISFAGRVGPLAGDRWTATVWSRGTGLLHGGGQTRPRIRSVRVGTADPEKSMSYGEVELVLTQWRDQPTEEPPQDRPWTQGMVRMTVSVDDPDTAIAALEDSGPEFPEKLEFKPGTKIGSPRVLLLGDPEGFAVELVHRPPRHFTDDTEFAGGAA